MNPIQQAISLLTGTAADVGQELGVVPSAVRNWHRGLRNPRKQNLENLILLLEDRAADLKALARELKKSNAK
jgi:transposase-like protein